MSIGFSSLHTPCTLLVTLVSTLPDCKCDWD